MLNQFNFSEAELKEVVRERGGKWFVFSKAGKQLAGPFDTRAEAVTRLGQIEFFKNK